MMRIDIRITDERLKKYVTLDEMIALQRGELTAIRDIMPRFMWDEQANDFYQVTVSETDEGLVVKADPRALKLLGSLTFDRLEALSADFKEKAEAVAVPPTSAAP